MIDQRYLWSPLVPLEGACESGDLIRAGFGLGADRHNFAGYTPVGTGSNQPHQDADGGSCRFYVPGVGVG